VRIRVGDLAGDPETHAALAGSIPKLIGDVPVDGSKPVETTVGRAILNTVFPSGFPYVNGVVLKSDLRRLIEEIIGRYKKSEIEEFLDGIKDLGFTFSTRAGLTIGLVDVKTPPEKPKIIAKYEKDDEKVQKQFHKGIITDDERRQELIEIWTRATDEVKDAMEATLKAEKFNPIDMMIRSGARGNVMQARQIAGMRGLVANPKGDIIPRPIISNFREGLSVLEYFISTHGARKGLADTALRTADSGYLTRRLVDVSQEVIVSIDDCETDRGIFITVHDENGRPNRYAHTSLLGRVLAADVKVGRKLAVTPAGEKLRTGTLLRRPEIEALLANEDVDRVKVRSVLTCDADQGVCASCYGLSLATGRPVELGEAVGIMAAQSIGEPGTQLTMRTFHTGGVAGEDITHGLPRVVELFEARTPKGKAVLSEVGGTVRIEEDEEGRRVVVDGPEGEAVYKVSRRARLLVRNGDVIEPGRPLTQGPFDPKEVLEISGVRSAQQYLVDQVQDVYRSQGVDIHDKHIEMIVRQMLRRVRIVSPNDSDFLPAELVDDRRFRAVNRELVAEGKTPAEGRAELMGITKASLATDSWLSAASFQETTRVLTEAAIMARSDGMRGLKENVIIGKLIPAGTGSKLYQNIEPLLPGATPISALSLFGEPTPSESEEDAMPVDPAEWLASIGGSEHVEDDE